MSVGREDGVTACGVCAVVRDVEEFDCVWVAGDLPSCEVEVEKEGGGIGVFGAGV